MVSSENFEITNFSAIKNTEDMTEFAGFIVPTWHGGIKVKENQTIRPRHILSPHLFLTDNELFSSLLKLRIKKSRIFNKIISAVEVFNESYYNSQQISQNARVLLQTSAFEILFGTGTGNGRATLKDFIKKYANYPDDKVYKYKSERKNGSVDERGTIKELWADRFFSLRNHITHGLVPKPREFIFGAGKWQKHFDIALYFFVFCVKRKIEEALRKQIFNDDVAWKTWEDDLFNIPPKKFTGFEYEHHGRRSWERMMKKLGKRKNKPFIQP